MNIRQDVIRVKRTLRTLAREAAGWRRQIADEHVKGLIE
jgi:hypothetical protein